MRFSYKVDLLNHQRLGYKQTDHLECKAFVYRDSLVLGFKLEMGVS